MVRKQHKVQADMLAHGLGQDDIEVGLGMLSSRKASISLFDRRKVGAALEEFIIISKLGQGAFGKVYLVHHEKKSRLYAMKCIRKDLVIENK